MPAKRSIKDVEEASIASSDGQDDVETMIDLKTLERIGKKIHHSFVEIRRILKKKAVGFETQKLVKRLKQSRQTLEALTTSAPEKVETKKKEIAKMETDLASLKTLNLDRLAALAVEKIMKVETIQPHHEKFMGYVPFKVDSLETQRVESRLLSSGPVTKLVDDLSGYVSQLVFIASKGKKRLPSKTALERKTKKARVEVKEDSVEESNEESMGENVEEKSNEDIKSESESGAGSDVESDVESDLESDLEDLPKLDRPLDKDSIEQLFKSTMNTQESDSESLEDVSMDDELDRSDWSGSEAESVEEEKPKSNAKSKIKNRMGQRARRMLAEKKYGTKAKHILDGGESVAPVAVRGRGRGVVRGRGVSDRGRGQERGRGGLGRGRGLTRPTNNVSRPLSKPTGRKPPETKALHPSWELKRQARRREEEKMATAKFQGTKIVFDE